MNGARCTARVRSQNSPHVGERCRNSPIPCGKVCLRHGGALPPVRAAAEKEYLALLAGDRGYLSPWAKREIVKSYEAGQRRWAKRMDKKYGHSFDGATTANPKNVRATEPNRDEAPDPFAYDGWN